MQVSGFLTVLYLHLTGRIGATLVQPWISVSYPIFQCPLLRCVVNNKGNYTDLTKNHHI